jgi:hypothetical protein
MSLKNELVKRIFLKECISSAVHTRLMYVPTTKETVSQTVKVTPQPTNTPA